LHELYPLEIFTAENNSTQVLNEEVDLDYVVRNAEFI
jgi:hypothetical protein